MQRESVCVDLIAVYSETADEKIRVMQMSAGVDMSMAVTATGDVYAWGKCDGGRIGLGLDSHIVNQPRLVPIHTRAVDVECGYVHSLILGADGTLFMCGGVGTDGQADGQAGASEAEKGENIDALFDGDTTTSNYVRLPGKPVAVSDFNIWHRLPEPKAAVVKTERWKKYGQYELKGRSKMMAESEKWGTTNQ